MRRRRRRRRRVVALAQIIQQADNDCGYADRLPPVEREAYERNEAKHSSLANGMTGSDYKKARARALPNRTVSISNK